MRLPWSIVAGVLVLVGMPVCAASTDRELLGWVEQLQSDDPIRRLEAREKLIDADDPRVAAPLMELLFFSREGRRDAGAILEEIFDTAPPDGSRAYTFWLEEVGRREELSPVEGYVQFKAQLYAMIDPAFERFLDPSHRRLIRPEEIVFGGVPKDGIPALDQPRMARATDADWMREDEIIFGLYEGGQARAYPRRIIDWHEMVNDTVGGTPVTLSWCTLCGAAIAYRGESGERTFTFGTSGLLYRSNKLMYDRQTESLWSQLSGEPVSGPLAGSAITLERLPLVVTTWRDWTAVHPDTLVLSPQTGFQRDYARAPYADYFASDDLMFPVWRRDDRLDRKEWVWTAEVGGVARAWRLQSLQEEPILNDVVGEHDVLLLTNPRSGGVRMFERKGRTFVAIERGAAVTDDGTRFLISETALKGEDGSKLERLPGHEAFWFAWVAAHPGTTLFAPQLPSRDK